jgi:hypothetical protein
MAFTMPAGCWRHIASSGRQFGPGGNLLLRLIVKSLVGWDEFEDALSPRDRSDPKAKQNGQR